MRIAIVSDAWLPQVNGVVRTLAATVTELMARGHDVDLIVPSNFFTLPLPGYAEIRLAVVPRVGTRRALRAFAPDIVHIATEGPLGWSARSWCLAKDVPFTTAFHTRFPDYASMRTGLPSDWFWPLMRRFHKPSRSIFVSTPTLGQELRHRGFDRICYWSRGIDGTLFRPNGPVNERLAALPRPLMLTVGRVAAEKNLEAFFHADVPGTKIVVGDGPMLTDLKKRYPAVVFLGKMEGAGLASIYRTADVFVFPSRTDTFGLVLIEALASGVPVATYPVPGPSDVLELQNAHSPVGALSHDLASAIKQALSFDRDDCAAFGARFSWTRCTDQFVDGLERALQVKTLEVV